ncbi:hypothetical protein COT99_03930 [Candidatus Falkowbacteria bacterium CG10_big_fil_rev_8_21_14_0_10_43_10]|uniref:Thioredoxin-like fold domain-containing protein n=1 Tax=Candidatus Falkowbacteria bacterium CG10_big_fil_rev_8_21_14_0_10_43_10 TaxID=1974567 RepID=A0A2H0V1A0_9BACT|nr:MAG: hypothetical protein COT99_03930 [Candidatus Falkowbacteria bacterium CG10_big_fil_rev_8_21_14_0_10_43_10]
MPNPNNYFSIKFIALSLTALLLFIIFTFFVLPSVLNKSEKKPELQKQNEKIYFNEKYKEEDPLLTQVPGLDDIITGPIITGADPAIGPGSALVDIVAYTDFECSYCYKAIQEAKKVQAELPEKVRLIHKDFPINEETSASFQAALAGRCAQEQNKFWEMSDLLYKNNYQLNSAIFNELAIAAGLNIKKFNDCLKNESAKKLVLDNIEEANALQIIGIPLFYVNGQEIMGEVSYQEIKGMVERELNK